MRTYRFTFLCNREERRLLATLAEKIQRSQSDALRWLVRGAVKELQIKEGSLGDKHSDISQQEPDSKSLSYS